MTNGARQPRREERMAARSVYKAYLESLNDNDNDADMQHLLNCVTIGMRDDLTQVQRKYLTLYLSGYTTVEIADMHNVNKSSVHRAIHRALDNLFRHVRYATPATLKQQNEHAST